MLDAADTSLPSGEKVTEYASCWRPVRMCSGFARSVGGWERAPAGAPNTSSTTASQMWRRSLAVIGQVADIAGLREFAGGAGMGKCMPVEPIKCNEPRQRNRACVEPPHGGE